MPVYTGDEFSMKISKKITIMIFIFLVPGYFIYD